MQLPEGASVISSSADTSRCLVVVGGVHGNEPAGIRALNTIKALVRDGDWQIDGNVYGLVGNPRAAEAGERFAEENLNRAFGRCENPHSYEARRAREIGAWLQGVANKHAELYVLDLHSVSIGETRIAAYNGRNEKTRRWAEQVSPLPFKLAATPEVLPGCLYLGYAESIGATGALIECGNHSSEVGATVALEHVERAFSALDMLTAHTTSFRGRVHYGDEPRTYELIEAIKPSAGFTFTIPVASETPLKRGEVYARDHHGKRCAPCDCFVIMPSKSPQPEDFDAGFLAVRTS